MRSEPCLHPHALMSISVTRAPWSLVRTCVQVLPPVPWRARLAACTFARLPQLSAHDTAHLAWAAATWQQLIDGSHHHNNHHPQQQQQQHSWDGWQPQAEHSGGGSGGNSPLEMPGAAWRDARPQPCDTGQAAQEEEEQHERRGCGAAGSAQRRRVASPAGGAPACAMPSSWLTRLSGRVSELLVTLTTPPSHAPRQQAHGGPPARTHHPAHASATTSSSGTTSGSSREDQQALAHALPTLLWAVPRLRLAVPPRHRRRLARQLLRHAGAVPTRHLLLACALEAWAEQQQHQQAQLRRQHHLSQLSHQHHHHQQQQQQQQRHGAAAAAAPPAPQHSSTPTDHAPQHSHAAATHSQPPHAHQHRRLGPGPAEAPHRQAASSRHHDAPPSPPPLSASASSPLAHRLLWAAARRLGPDSSNGGPVPGGGAGSQQLLAQRQRQEQQLRVRLLQLAAAAPQVRLPTVRKAWRAVRAGLRLHQQGGVGQASACATQWSALQATHLLRAAVQTGFRAPAGDLAALARVALAPAPALAAGTSAAAAGEVEEEEEEALSSVAWALRSVARASRLSWRHRLALTCCTEVRRLPPRCAPPLRAALPPSALLAFAVTEEVCRPVVHRRRAPHGGKPSTGRCAWWTSPLAPPPLPPPRHR